MVPNFAFVPHAWIAIELVVAARVRGALAQNLQVFSLHFEWLVLRCLLGLHELARKADLPSAQRNGVHQRWANAVIVARVRDRGPNADTIYLEIWLLLPEIVISVAPARL